MLTLPKRSSLVCCHKMVVCFRLEIKDSTCRPITLAAYMVGGIYSSFLQQWCSSYVLFRNVSLSLPPRGSCVSALNQRVEEVHFVISKARPSEAVQLWSGSLETAALGEVTTGSPSTEAAVLENHVGALRSASPAEPPTAHLALPGESPCASSDGPRPGLLST